MKRYPHIVWSQKLSIPPPQNGFFLRPPHHSGNSSQASHIYLQFWAFENPPPPPGIFNSFCGGSIDIFCYQNFSTKNITSKNETGSRVGLNSRHVQRPLATDCSCVSSKITKRLSEYYFFTYMSTSTATITNSAHTYFSLTQA